MYYQKKLLEKYTYEIEHLPKGRLICCKNGKQCYYYIAVKRDGEYVRSSINQDIEMQKKLARKEFLAKTISALEGNIVRLERAASGLKTVDPHEIIESLPKAYRELPENYFFDETVWAIDNKTDKEVAARIARHKEWRKAPFEQSTFKPEQRKHTTSLGFKVRSKSELIIVEQLAFYNVPFRYEQVMHVGDRYFVPDFTFESCDGHQFYWEHAGMMNDDNYADRHLRKMEMYRHMGIVPWKNLIVTYDNDSDINSQMIKNVIEYEVIPRL